MSRLQQALLAAVAVVLLLLASLHFVVVRVHERGPDGMKIWLPLPIELAQAALWFVPDYEKHFDTDTVQIERFSPLAQALLEALEEIDKVELVRVNEGDQTVVVRKAGADIEINVRTDRKEVKVRLAMRTLQGLVDSFDEGRFDAAGAMSALKYSSGLVVHVDEPDTEVSLTIW
ncbi:MAG: hypothetical protein OXL36_18570 [Bryobacterales bacterium]|nr:hypothetical protein [Bryobacterales bacterium]MDE0295798.1 hypothetical protein [Bryobacterales bacterium]